MNTMKIGDVMFEYNADLSGEVVIDVRPGMVPGEVVVVNFADLDAFVRRVTSTAASSKPKNPAAAARRALELPAAKERATKLIQELQRTDGGTDRMLNKMLSIAVNAINGAR